MEPLMDERLDLTQDMDFPVTDAGAQGSRVCPASLTVVNESPTPICHMWIEWAESQYSESFGYNWLGDEQIAPGEARVFLVRPASYNLKAEDCESHVLRVELEIPIDGPIIWDVTGPGSPAP